MMPKDLKYYIERFQHLRQAPTKYGPAPHKAILLLGIIRGIELGFITENKIVASPMMISLFKTTWNALVTSGNLSAFTLPFFHLRTSKFWHFKAKDGFENWLSQAKAIHSLNLLQMAIQYAYFDGELFMLLSSSHSRNILKSVLMERNFPDVEWKSLTRKTYFDKIAEEIARKKPEKYVAQIDALEKSLDKECFEEELYIRSAAFRREVSKAYSYTCCISGLRIDTVKDFFLIDACHIEPFATSHDDTITNGICLCPTLHRAFDRHLISFDEDYRLILSKAFVERSNSPYSISQFEGNHMMLPANRAYYPSQEKLQRHRELLVT